MTISSSGQERRNWLFSSMMRVSRQLWQNVWPQDVSRRGTLSLLYSFVQSGHSKSLSITESNYKTSQKRKRANISNYHPLGHCRSWWSLGTLPLDSWRCSPASNQVAKYPTHQVIYPSHYPASYSWCPRSSAPRTPRTLASPPVPHPREWSFPARRCPSSHIFLQWRSTQDCYQRCLVYVRLSSTSPLLREAHGSPH